MLIASQKVHITMLAIDLPLLDELFTTALPKVHVTSSGPDVVEIFSCVIVVTFSVELVTSSFTFKSDENVVGCSVKG